MLDPHPSANLTGRVLVLGTDQRVMLAIARSLGRHGLEVHLGWCPAQSIAARSRYVQAVHGIPAYTPDNSDWKHALRGLLSREAFDLVIPCNDSTLVPLVANRADFAEFPHIYLISDRAFHVVSDKFNTHALAQAQGVQVPRGEVTDGYADPDQLIERYGLPLVLKPQATITVGNVGLANVVRKIHSRDELAAILPGLGSDRVLIQENFFGRGVGVEMLVHQGQVLFAFQHARIHETVEWGSTYRRSVPVDPELLAAAKRMMAAVGYTGVAMAEFIVDPATGRWVFLEINGRFWGSLPLAVAAGADFPYYLYQMLVEGRREFAVPYRRAVRCRNLLLDWVWLKNRYRHARCPQLLLPWGLARELGSIVWHRDHFDSFSLDDPRPQWAEIGELLRRAGSKAARKLLGRKPAVAGIACQPARAKAPSPNEPAPVESAEHDEPLAATARS